MFEININLYILRGFKGSAVSDTVIVDEVLRRSNTCSEGEGERP